jgi:hypothetical protein
MTSNPLLSTWLVSSLYVRGTEWTENMASKNSSITVWHFKKLLASNGPNVVDVFTGNEFSGHINRCLFCAHYSALSCYATLLKIPDTHKIQGYYKFVDGILIVYSSQVTNIKNMLQEINHIHSQSEFTIQNKNSYITFLDKTITKNNKSQFAF